MKTTTKVILGAAALSIVFAVARSDTSPRRMAEVEVNTCFRKLPDAGDMFKVVERMHALKYCNAMKEMYIKKFNAPYTNY